MNTNRPVDSLWGKKSYANDVIQDNWLPLSAHMRDVAEITRILWNSWVSDGVRNCIADGICTDQEKTPAFVEGVVVSVSFTHDLGKCTPAYYSRHRVSDFDKLLCKQAADAGFHIPRTYPNRDFLNHSTLSHYILTRAGFSPTFSVVAGGHHGVPPTSSGLRNLIGYSGECGIGDTAWESAQSDLIAEAVTLSGIPAHVLKSVSLSSSAQILLTSIVIMADWIGSNPCFTPMLKHGEPISSLDFKARASAAYKSVGLTSSWTPAADFDDLYALRFGITPRPTQKALLDVVKTLTDPGIVVVEGPPASGKTEGALVTSEVFCFKSGRRGVEFALPTQASSNFMFSRLLKWLRRFDRSESLSVNLMHNRAELNEDFAKMSESKTPDNYVMLNDWFEGRKKSILADFTVGTIDQVLMAGLRHRHVVLRHLGLANKVVIIDECHAFDVYMESYLLNVLFWLGRYKVPVIILSATLPSARKKAVIEAYMRGRGVKAKKLDAGTAFTEKAYPLITYSDGTRILTRTPDTCDSDGAKKVSLRPLSESALIPTLTDTLSDGGCIGIIVNTVRRAREIFNELSKHFPAELIHAGFMSVDRTKKEKHLEYCLGKDGVRPHTQIFIGTQVFEQSLDIDFDLLITELCPVDLLLQRIGRLHRFLLQRPSKLSEPVCYIFDSISAGSVLVYGKYPLLKTDSVLTDTLTLPDDIRGLVESVYDTDSDGAFEKELSEWLDRLDRKQKRSVSYQLTRLSPSDSLLDWLELSRRDTEVHGTAAVRDGMDSIDVILVTRSGDKLSPLRHVMEDTGHVDGIPFRADEKPAENVAKLLLGCTVHLPVHVCRGDKADTLIGEIQRRMRSEGLEASWSTSKWLKDMLCIVLDENQTADICGNKFTYSVDTGLDVT